MRLNTLLKWVDRLKHAPNHCSFQQKLLLLSSVSGARQKLYVEGGRGAAMVGASGVLQLQGLLRTLVPVSCAIAPERRATPNLHGCLAFNIPPSIAFYIELLCKGGTETVILSGHFFCPLVTKELLNVS